MLQESHLLLELFWELVELILGEDVLLLTRADRFTLVVVEAVAFIFRNNLGRIVEKDASRVIREQISQPVLCRVIDPFSDPN